MPLPTKAVLSGHFATVSLYDCDSSYNWGWNIFLKRDNTFSAIGWGLNNHTGFCHIDNLNISSDGRTLRSTKLLVQDSTNFWLGSPGEMENTANSGYYIPATIAYHPNGIWKSTASLIKMDSNWDTIFVKKYTDTNYFFDNIYASARSTDRSFFLGGGRASHINSYMGLLICTDTLGNLLWTRTYPSISGEAAWFTNLIPISRNRVAASAMSRSYYFIGTTSFYRYKAIFMILDSSGNVLKDTAYGRRYSDGGNISLDRMGGYMQWGWIDTVVNSSYGEDLHNFPTYIAHLDTNFRMDWQFVLTSNESIGGRRTPFQIKQLKDGNFILFGDEERFFQPFDVGWAMKVSRTGEEIWQHTYFSDSNNYAYLRDMVERPDGSLVFIGRSYNDTLPAWHNNGDLWLLGVDSNGCELPGCSNGLFPDAVPPEPKQLTDFNIYPNPISGLLQINSSKSGTFILLSIDGREVSKYELASGQNAVQFPATIAEGLYMGIFKPSDGSGQIVTKLVYKP